MAVTQTTRFQLYRWSSGADQFTRAQMTESHDNLEAEGAGYSQAGSRPAAAAEYEGFFHYDSTDSSVGTLSYCNGTAWFDVGAPGSVTSLDGATSDGTSNFFARADHTHALDNSIVTTAKLNDLAVTTGKLDDLAVTEGKIGSGAVTNAKLAATGLDASKLTEGELPVARIASGAITNAKLAATGFDATKLTTGILPIARIDDGAVTNAKLADMNANTVKIRQSSAGAPQNVEIGEDRVLGRSGSGALQSVQIVRDMIAAGQVSFNEMQNTSGYSILGKSGSGSGLITAITAGTDSVLRRDGSGNLAFGKIDGNHITSNSITATQINASAVGSSELADDAVDTAAIQNNAVTGAKILNNTIALGTKTSGDYVAAISAGNDIVVSGSGSEGADVEVTHATFSTTTNTNYHNNGRAITSISYDNGHVTDVKSYDFDGRFLNKADTYGDSSANDGRRIFVQAGTPSYGAAGNLWFQI